ncbi:ERI1 exoribonuclease 3 [Lobulomyces angularis]|nr:ERI1 exoribonuclease 3 [Lobulomyces angularis]
MSWANIVQKDTTATKFKNIPFPLASKDEDSSRTFFEDKKKSLKPYEQTYDYFMVLDFEATCCDRDKRFVNEIIEFPIVVLDGRNGVKVQQFREYVRPTKNKVLTEFCINLTGIQQETVDEAALFPQVFNSAKNFYNKFHNENPCSRSIFVTCGDWDLKSMLPRQAKNSNVKVPVYFQEWINIKTPFKLYLANSKIKNNKRLGMPTMLKTFGLPLIGRHHSGLDDCRNICNITYKLIQNGILLEKTGEWSQELKEELSEKH